MKIHQSKGLQFPVVIIGSLNDNKHSLNPTLDLLHKRPNFEPANRIAEFDVIREYYVAFSRAEKLLVLTTSGQPNRYLKPVLNQLSCWPHIQENILQTLNFKSKTHFLPKKTYNITRDIKVFETCPRQYQLYHVYGFSPSRSATTTFGTLVHQTIEDIHKMVLEGRLGNITNETIRHSWFESNYRNLILFGMRPLSRKQKYFALDHVLDYFNQNYDNLQRIIQTEVNVSIEKSGYIMTGRIDLLLGDDGNLEVLDFKTLPKPQESDPACIGYIFNIFNSVSIHIYSKKDMERNLVGFTFIGPGERDRDKALVQFNPSSYDIQSSIDYFDNMVQTIKSKDFRITKIPDLKVCREYDFRTYCSQEGTITFKPNRI